MKKLIFSALIAIAAVGFVSYDARAQDEIFSDPNVDYTFALPDARWKKIATPSATSPNVEYVFNDRVEGKLEVRRLNVQKSAITSDIVRDEEQKLQFLPGYAPGREENFAGKLKGVIFNFEYVKGGRQMSGRHYFLRANDTTLYVLRFDGRKDSLRGIQNQTDSIARTFAIAAAK